MSKLVTKERLVKALTLVNSWRNAEIEKLGDVIHAACSLGFKSMLHASLGQPLPESEMKKGRLEIQYSLDKPAMPWELLQMRDRYFYLAHRRCHWRDCIHEIQRRHKISGLKGDVIEIGGRLMPHQCGIDERLAIIPEDLDVLRHWKGNFVFLAVLAIQDKNLTIYRRSASPELDEWIPTKESEIYAALPFYDWASVWEMKNEIHVFLGTGVDLDNPSESIWFCASDRIPPL